MCGVTVPLDHKRLMLLSRLDRDKEQVRNHSTTTAVCFCTTAATRVGDAKLVSCNLCRASAMQGLPNLHGCMLCCNLQVIFKMTEYGNLALGLFRSRAEMHRRATRTSE